jgi:hypothetical protein
MLNPTATPEPSATVHRVHFVIPDATDDPELETLSVMMQALNWKLKGDLPAKRRIVDYLRSRLE